MHELGWGGAITMDKLGGAMDKWGAPWTSMTTSASSGRDPTGWSSSANTSSPDRWHRTQLIRYSSHSLNLSCQHVLQIMDNGEKQHTGFGFRLWYFIQSTPHPPYPAKIGNVHRIYSTHWTLSPTPAVRRAADCGPLLAQPFIKLLHTWPAAAAAVSTHLQTYFNSMAHYRNSSKPGSWKQQFYYSIWSQPRVHNPQAGVYNSFLLNTKEIDCYSETQIIH